MKIKTISLPKILNIPIKPLTMMFFSMLISTQANAGFIYTFEGSIGDNIDAVNSELRDKYSYLGGSNVKFSVLINSNTEVSLSKDDEPYTDYTLSLISSSFDIPIFGDFIDSTGTSDSSIYLDAAAGFDFGYSIRSRLKLDNFYTDINFSKNIDECFIECSISSVYFGNWNIGDQILFSALLDEDPTDAFNKVVFFSDDMRLTNIQAVPVPPSIWLFFTGLIMLSRQALKRKQSPQNVNHPPALQI
ncbi:hypothetical protein MNBD_GAMMA08-2053 [hydrothermal vent metagenome]|uniref:Uncharacterized protein n=1 Tax=hydrothermal vent metagenome TaxID=652676 RepID=A0A3B0XGA6_9ZZZZ